MYNVELLRSVPFPPPPPPPTPPHPLPLTPFYTGCSRCAVLSTSQMAKSGLGWGSSNQKQFQVRILWAFAYNTPTPIYPYFIQSPTLAWHLVFFQSVRWKILLGFTCRNRLLLTGTPIQNSMAEVCLKLTMQ
jgi:hypothetical protein